jgi:hypothetical protein
LEQKERQMPLFLLFLQYKILHKIIAKGDTNFILYALCSIIYYCNLAICLLNFASSGWYFAGLTLEAFKAETTRFIS